MSSNKILEQLRKGQERLAEIRADVSTTRPVGWRAKEMQLGCVEKRLEAGNPLALYDGLILCRDGELPLPPWLSEGLTKFLVEASLGEAKGKKGKGNSFLGDVTKARKLHLRASTVWAIREVQTDRELWSVMPEPLLSKFFGGFFLDFGKTEEDAFRIAAQALRGTFAQGGEVTMKRAYRALCKGVDRYGLLLGFFETEVAFGLRMESEGEPKKLPEWLDDWKQGKSIKP